jgi:threonine dehydratase
VADGLLPLRPGDLTFAHAQRFIDEVVTVDDDQIVDAVLWLVSNAKIVVEPSGAATVAAALAGAGPSQRPVVAVVSGGNMDLEKLEEFRRTRKQS